LAEINSQIRDNDVRRFISTHPDQDHISGLAQLDDQLPIVNFYCVKNEATKSMATIDFKRYCKLRDNEEKAFYISRGCKRRWMNQSDEQRGSAGINVLWPIPEDADFKSALADAKAGLPPNNISAIFTYSVENGATFIWMGDLETDFMEKLEPKIRLPKIDVLFAPHHGRDSGKVPKKWLAQLDPELIVIGEAPSEYLNYYGGYDTITQNSCGEMIFDCVDEEKAHIYVGEHTYDAPYLDQEGKDHMHGLYYAGTLPCGA
jgi:beta-lactamase superfamily II metal-dependent hydrolase